MKLKTQEMVERITKMHVQGNRQQKCIYTRTQVDLYFGHSPTNAFFVTLVLILNFGTVSPQFFSALTSMTLSTDPKNSYPNEWKVFITLKITLALSQPKISIPLS